MKSRLLFSAVLAAALLLSTGAGCGKKLYPPEFVSVPDNVFAGDSAHLRLITMGRGYASVGCIMDWDDSVETNSMPFPLGDTATVFHVWSTPGVKQVRARAFPNAYPDRFSDWSQPETVRVLAGGEHAPTIGIFFSPPVAVKSIEAFFAIKGADPGGDSIRFHVVWGDSSDTTTSFDSSPCSVVVAHVYTSTGTFTAAAEAEDIHGARSEPESISIAVGTAGSVTWLRLNNGEPPRPFMPSPVIAFSGGVERLFYSDKGDHEFHSIRTSDGMGEKKAATRWPGHDFTGQPAVCEATQHIIVGSDEGELYALTVDGLDKDWHWPDNPESLLTGVEWGAPAIKDNRLYVPRPDDSLFLFQDVGSQGNRVAAYPTNTSVIDAPVIDAQGNVYFGTDSGYLYKMGPELDTVFWRTHLLANGEIHGPTIGSDGTIYCGSDSFHLYAIDPATGVPYWTVTLDGDVFRPAIGQSAIFVASSSGKACSINPATGGINWEKQLRTPYGADEQFSTTPIVAANGYVYFQSENDVLYCVNQANGLVIWYCDCPRYLSRTGGSPHRPRRVQLTDYLPNPTILANGNIIVPGSDALYCVAGYPEGPLDPLAAWPKWQHDLYNTGFVGGGR